tara:strand:- start:360 stop:737 length:378 start_codon:yes stop_codon:yes gene_type:complete
MLLDTHTVAKAKKVYRKEARKIFIREICKNLMEVEMQQEVPGYEFNSKLLQNYCAMLIVYQFLMVPEKKVELNIKDQRVKAIQQQIRRYDAAQKQQILYQIIFEMQITPQRAQKNNSDGIVIALF